MRRSRGCWLCGGGGGGGGAEKGLMNAGGMLQECRTGREKGGGGLLFFFSRGSPLNQRRCGPMGNQRIIIPLLLTFPPLQNTHSRLPPHTHPVRIPAKLSLLCVPSQLGSGVHLPSFADVFLFFYLFTTGASRQLPAVDSEVRVQFTAAFLGLEPSSVFNPSSQVKATVRPSKVAHPSRS